MHLVDSTLMLLPLEASLEQAPGPGSRVFQVGQISIRPKGPYFELITPTGSHRLRHEDIISVKNLDFQVVLDHREPPPQPKPLPSSLHSWEEANDPLGFLYSSNPGQLAAAARNADPRLDVYLENSGNILQELGIEEKPPSTPSQSFATEPSPWDLADELLNTERLLK